jgi:hypothetical protein
MLTLMAAVVKYVILEENSYTAFVADDRFAEDMTAFVRETLESDCLFYDLPFSVLDESVTAEAIGAYSEQYAEKIYDSLQTGEELAVPVLDAAPYVTAVSTFFESLPEEEQPLDNTAADTVGGELAANAAAVLKAGMNDTFLTMGYTVLSHSALKMLGDGFVWLVMTTVGMVVICVFMGIRRLRYQVYAIGFSCLLGATFVFVPLWLLQRYDLSSHLVVGDSPLKLYIDGILNGIVEQSLAIAGWCFFILLLAFLIGIVIAILPVTYQKERGIQD